MWLHRISSIISSPHRRAKVAQAELVGAHRSMCARNPIRKPAPSLLGAPALSLKDASGDGPVGLVDEPEFPWTELDDVARSISRFSSRRNWFRVLNGETGHQRSTMRLSESNPDSSGCADSICGAAPTLRGNIDTPVNAVRNKVLVWATQRDLNSATWPSPDVICTKVGCWNEACQWN